ncbi:MAG TPA: hypothetical protein VFM27_08650 [Acidimicrobiales bacterium]|nr:hypothetical protein [Acidimicrobiales bacterium]
MGVRRPRGGGGPARSRWACPATMLMENNLDPAHIAFVHRGSLGSPAEPRCPPPA